MLKPIPGGSEDPKSATSVDDNSGALESPTVTTTSEKVSETATSSLAVAATTAPIPTASSSTMMNESV
jgi:hypothetical protein